MIHDYVSSKNTGIVKFPKLKGHVKIALKDIHTGKTDVAFEGDNMITKAVEDIFASNLCGCMDYRTMLPLYSKMFGGVLLFRNDLDISSQDADKDYYIPTEATNSVIAHAGQTAFSDQSDDVKRGNPLATSMIVADGAVTLAWEWGSAAGNGKMKSIALTHTDVGNAGTGSTSQAFQAMTPNINATFGISPTQPTVFIDKDGYGYHFYTSGSTVYFTKYPFAYQQVGLVGLPYNYVSGIQKSKSITVGTNFSGYFPHFYFDKENYLLYLFYNTSVSTTVNVDIIDLSDFDNLSYTHATWSGLGESVGPLSGGGNQAGPCAVAYYNGYVYLPKYDGNNNALGLLRVNLSSTADQTYLAASSTCDGGSGVFVPNTTNRIVAGKCFVINGNNLYKTAVGSPDVVHGWDGGNRWGDATMNSDEGLVHTVLCKRHNNASTLYYPSISKFYLATKFNFAEIEKKNTQNMVVTYTLTEVSE